jgi:hypothetical protein
MTHASEISSCCVAPGIRERALVSAGEVTRFMLTGRRLFPGVLWSLLLSLLICDQQGGALAGVVSASQTSTPKNAPQQPRLAPLAFAPMPADTVQSQLLNWLARAKTDAATAEQVAALWADREALTKASAEELLDRVVDSLALADPGTRRFRDACRSAEAVESPVFDGLRSDDFYQQCVRLYHARWLTQHRFFDEALSLFEALNPENSIDPAGLFFYRAVCQQRLLQPEAARESLSLLLHNTVDVPDRFRAVAVIMQQELADQEAAGLEEVARVMSDVQRRLDLGRSDEKVQEQEGEVIALLDKLLEDLQQQQQQQQNSGGAGSGGQNQPGQQGAAESGIKGSAADGEADRRKLAETGAWGMLDKQSETQARELIRQKFPSNYLDAISRYTKKIAERK